VYLPTYELSAHGNNDEAQGVHDDESAMLLPLLESQLAIDALDDILAVPGLRGIFLGMGDLSVILGHPNDYTHPDLTAFIADTVARAAKHDVAVFSNIHGRPTIDGVEEAAFEFESIGVKGIFVPRDSAVLVRYYRDLMDRLHGRRATA
jgi:2-keto-3-deoxy-L-rhamnonate aldolase RhmA